MARSPARRSPAAASKTAAKAAGAKLVAPRPVLQWVAAALGLAITLAAIGVILADALGPQRPVALSARMQAVRPAGSAWLVEVQVHNTGDDAAAAVELTGQLNGETASATLDYVPGNGDATAFLVFSSSPKATPPALSVSGWAKP